jgi:hypothetical protein
VARDLFITNLLETSRYMKETSLKIPNFFNSDNNAKIISYFNDIKNIIFLSEHKTLDKIKILLLNNPIKYTSTINLINDIGEDYFMDFIVIKNNFHNIMKTLIFKQIYIKEDKDDILKMIAIEEKKNTVI